MTDDAVPADTLAEWLRSFARDVGRPTIDGYEVRYLNRCADEIERLRAALNTLDVTIAHPHMSGDHQCKIGADHRSLPAEVWATIQEARCDD